MRKLSVALLLLVFVVVGCKLGAIKDMISGGAPGGGSSKGTATGGSDPKEDIIQASKKFIALPAFSAKMEGVGQTEIKSQVDYVAPDRYHISYLGGTGAGLEMIMIGNQSYMKSGGKWSKFPGGESNSKIPTLRDSFTEEGLKTLTDVKFEGDDTIDGKPALVYSYKNVTPVGDYPFTSKIWVGKDTGVPIKIFVEYTNGVLKHMTVNYDTDSPVTIEAPIK
jgi:outer membrane lipoprotein-sorting protein